MKYNPESLPKQRWPDQPIQLQLGFEIPDFATSCINSLNSADAQDKTCSSHSRTFQCWSSKALITQHFTNVTSWSFNCKRSRFVVPWIYELWFPTDLCFYHHYHRNPRLPACPFPSTQLAGDSRCCGLSRLCHRRCQKTRVSAGSVCPDLGGEGCSGQLYNPPLRREPDRSFPPSPSLAKNKPRLNVSVTPHKGALCFPSALLLRCQAVRSRWQMENPTPSSLDVPRYKSKRVDLIFPLQHVLLLTDSQFRDKLHCALGFKCLSAPFPWQ